MDARKTRILARFTAAPSVTTEHYDETVRRLEKSKEVGIELAGEPEMLEIHNIIKR